MLLRCTDPTTRLTEGKEYKLKSAFKEVRKGQTRPCDPEEADYFIVRGDNDRTLQVRAARFEVVNPMEKLNS